MLFVEQPFHRDVVLREDAVGEMADWPDRPPLIIDESDGAIESLPQALRLGYAGTSHKNCKGIVNVCLLAQRRREQPAQPAILSGEDLANIGPVALLQDLPVCRPGDHERRAQWAPPTSRGSRCFRRRCSTRS